MARILTLSEENHVYDLDGEELPSVSEITRFISRELYNDIPQYTLERAAERGTNVHKLTEALDKYGSCEADEELLNYLTAYVDFRNKYPAVWEKIEFSTFNETERYGMTVDRYGELNGKKILVDIKTSSSIQTIAVTAQLTLYKMGLESQGYQVDELYCVQLKKDNRFVFKKIEPDYELASACLILHSRLTKRKRKNKQNKWDSEES